MLINSCVYLHHPFTYKLTRGNWIKDTVVLKFNDLPKLVSDTLSGFYNRYYAKDSVFYPELISLTQNVNVSFVEHVTFPSNKFLLDTPGYHFKIGNKKYFFDYRKFRLPIVYYDDALYYFSGEYYVKKERYTFESKSDYENKLFIKYTLKQSNFKKNNRPTAPQ